MNLLLVLAFAAAIGLGATTAWLGLREQRPAIRLATVHGIVALGGLSLLGYRVFTGPENLWFNSAFFLFLLTVIGGVFMLLVRRRDEPPFAGLIALHAITGVVAFLVLLGGMGG